MTEIGFAAGPADNILYQYKVGAPEALIIYECGGERKRYFVRGLPDGWATLQVPRGATVTLSGGLVDVEFESGAVERVANVKLRETVLRRVG